MKRGLSDVVTTVLIILLVVVSVVAIGAYVTNLVRSSGRTVEREGACLANTIKVDGCRQFISADGSAPARTVVSIASTTDTVVKSVSELSYIFTYNDGKSETFTSTNSLPVSGKSSVSQDVGYITKKPTSVQVGAKYILTDGKTVSCPPTPLSSCVTESSIQASFFALSPQSLLVLGSIGSGVSNPVSGAGSTGSSAVSFIPFTSQCMGNSPTCFGSADMAACLAIAGCYWNNPYAWYRFEESGWTGAPGEVKDSTGRWNATAYNGVTTAVSSGRIGRVGAFDISGVLTQRAVTDQVVTHGIGPGGFTWSAWVLPGSTQPYAGAVGNGAFAPALYSRINSQPSWGAYFATSGVNTPNVLPTTQWAHITMVRQPGTNSVSFYQNGSFISTQTVPSLSIADAQTVIGGSSTANGNWALLGKLDDLRLYNRELSRAEILALYRNSIT